MLDPQPPIRTLPIGVPIRQACIRRSPTVALLALASIFPDPTNCMPVFSHVPMVTFLRNDIAPTCIQRWHINHAWKCTMANVSYGS